MGADTDNGSEWNSVDNRHMESFGMFVADAGGGGNGQVNLHVSPKFSEKNPESVLRRLKRFGTGSGVALYNMKHKSVVHGVLLSDQNKS